MRLKNSGRATSASERRSGVRRHRPQDTATHRDGRGRSWPRRCRDQRRKKPEALASGLMEPHECRARGPWEQALSSHTPRVLRLGGKQERGPSSVAEDDPGAMAEALPRFGRPGLGPLALLPWPSRGPFGHTSASPSASSALRAAAGASPHPGSAPRRPLPPAPFPPSPGALAPFSPGLAVETPLVVCLRA